MASRHIVKFALLVAVFIVGSVSVGTSAAPGDALLADAAEQRQLGLVDELLNFGRQRLVGNKVLAQPLQQCIDQ